MSALAVPVCLEPSRAARQLTTAPPDVQSAIRRMAPRLAADPQHGTFIAPTRVPRATIRAWQRRVGAVERLYKLDLPFAWRSLYTITTVEGRRCVGILEIVSHREYDRLLGYG